MFTNDSTRTIAGHDDSATFSPVNFVDAFQADMEALEQEMNARRQGDEQAIPRIFLPGDVVTTPSGKGTLVAILPNRRLSHRVALECGLKPAFHVDELRHADEPTAPENKFGLMSA